MFKKGDFRGAQVFYVCDLYVIYGRQNILRGGKSEGVDSRRMTTIYSVFSLSFW